MVSTIPGDREERVNHQQGRRAWLLRAAGVIVVSSLACSPAAAHRDAASAVTATPATTAPQTQDRSHEQVIDHITPARDSVGPAPTRFVWTAIQGADSYSIGIWNEVDRMVWRLNGIEGTSVARPADVELEPGTYFWTVSALRDGDQIAESGLAAFVVRTIP